MLPWSIIWTIHLFFFFYHCLSCTEVHPRCLWVKVGRTLDQSTVHVFPSLIICHKRLGKTTGLLKKTKKKQQHALMCIVHIYQRYQNRHFTVTPICRGSCDHGTTLEIHRWREFHPADTGSQGTHIKNWRKSNTSWHVTPLATPMATWWPNLTTQCPNQKHPARGHTHVSLHRNAEIPLNWQMYLQGGCNLISLSSVNVNHKIAISYQILKGKKWYR